MGAIALAIFLVYTNFEISSTAQIVLVAAIVVFMLSGFLSYLQGVKTDKAEQSEG